jgi:hypothetical protein
LRHERIFTIPRKTLSAERCREMDGIHIDTGLYDPGPRSPRDLGFTLDFLDRSTVSLFEHAIAASVLSQPHQRHNHWSHQQQCLSRSATDVTTHSGHTLVPSVAAVSTSLCYSKRLFSHSCPTCCFSSLFRHGFGFYFDGPRSSRQGTPGLKSKL